MANCGAMDDFGGWGMFDLHGIVYYLLIYSAIDLELSCT